MAEIRQYFFSVTAAATICGVLSTLLKGCQAQPVLRVFLGLFLTTVVLKPVTGFDPAGFGEWSSPFSENAQIHVSSGEEMGRDALRSSITQALEEYILTKARELQMEIQVEIILDQQDPPVPMGVKLYGDPPEDRLTELQKILESELGITKEHQQWIGPN